MNELLKRYLECLRAGDAEKLSGLFTEDAIFHDEAPVKMGGNPLHLEGRSAIKGMFKKILAGGGLKVENAAINQNAMRYDVTVGDKHVLALGVIFKVKDGCIQEYRVVSA